MSSPPHGLMGAFDRSTRCAALAIVWMALFHFGFDLNHFHLLDRATNFHRDPLWTTQRTCIVSLFLLCAGLGQALALHAAAAALRFTPGFWRRWAQVAGCAVLVSLGSAFMFPRSWISFGVLHGMAVMLILARGWPLLGPLKGGCGRWRAGASRCRGSCSTAFFDHPSATGWAWSRTSPSPKTGCRCCPGWA
jgi:hypothetical protein